MSITKDLEGARRAAVGAWQPSVRYDVDGVGVAVARRGSGVPVVCLHAIAHGALDFEAFAERVADRCEVIAIDWPGQGRSDASAVAASAASYADLLEQLLPRLARSPVVLLGCSIGGAAAIQVAARRPDLVRGLVLCNTGGLLPVDAFTRFATARLSNFFARGAAGATWYRAAFGLYYRMVLPSASAKAQRQRIVSAAYETAGLLAEAWSSFGAPDADLRALLPAVTQPTLVAWARFDQILPWWRHRATVAKIPNGRVELFRGGHAAFLEDPDRFAATFRSFLADVERSAHAFVGAPSDVVAVNPIQMEAVCP